MNTEQGQLSALSAISTVAELGLELDGRRAYLIPFKNEVTLIIGYKGLVELVLRNDDISHIHSDKVCENDVFKYNKGVVEEHIIDFSKPRGKAYAYYSMVVFENGKEKAEVLQLEEVELIRSRAPGKNSEAWRDNFDEMAKKTAFRRCCKWVTLPQKAQDAITHEDKEYIDITPRQSKFEKLEIRG